MMIVNTISDRLYLSKGDQELFVDVEDLAQHQVDGIRYLYRQFKKKKPGIIINDPPGYGKRIQIIAFLSAIHNILENPILVLCSEDDCDKWRRRFSRSIVNEASQIITQSSEGLNPFAKCRVLITTTLNAGQCSRRSWSIVIIDDNDNKKVLKSNLDGFKIWVTAVDMKEQLDLFSSIYHWYCPKEKFSISEYIADKKNVSDVVAKSVLVDAFMEDIVLRRRHVMIESTRNENIDKKIALIPSCKKNKDATGTKTKRSKRVLEDQSRIIKPLIVENSELKSTDRGPKVIKYNNATETSETVEMDVESFIRDHKPITSENFKEFVFEDVLDISNEDESTDNISIEVDTIPKKHNQNDVNLFEDITEDHQVVNESLDDLKIIPNCEVNGSDCTGIDLKEDTVAANINISDSELNYEYNKNVHPKADIVASDIELDGDENKVEFELVSEVEGDIKTDGLNSSDNDYPKTDLERQILEMELKAMKKYKGSLLDSIF